MDRASMDQRTVAHQQKSRGTEMKQVKWAKWALAMLAIPVEPGQSQGF